MLLVWSTRRVSDTIIERARHGITMALIRSGSKVQIPNNSSVPCLLFFNTLFYYNDLWKFLVLVPSRSFKCSQINKIHFSNFKGQVNYNYCILGRHWHLRHLQPATGRVLKRTFRISTFFQTIALEHVTTRKTHDRPSHFQPTSSLFSKDETTKGRKQRGLVGIIKQ